MNKIIVIVIAIGGALALLYLASANSISKATVNAGIPATNSSGVSGYGLAPAIGSIGQFFSSLTMNPSPVTPTVSAGITTGPSLSQAGLASGYLSTSQNVTAGLPSVANLQPPSPVLPLTSVNSDLLSPLPPGIDSPGISTDNPTDPTDYVGTGGVYYS